MGWDWSGIWGWAVDIWRNVNFLLSLLALTLVISRAFEFRKQWTHQEVAFTRATIVLTVAGVAGSSWNFFAGFDFSLGMPFTTIGMGLLIYATQAPPERFALMHAQTSDREAR